MFLGETYDLYVQISCKLQYFVPKATHYSASIFFVFQKKNKVQKCLVTSSRLGHKEKPEIC